MLHMPHLLIPPDFTDSKTCLTSTRSPAHQDTAQKPRPRRADRKPCARSRGCKRGFASRGAACAATGISSLPPQADAAGCGDGWARAACLPTGPAETGDPVRWVWDGGEGRWSCLCVCLAVGKVRQVTEGKRLWRVPRKDGQELYRDGTQLLPGASQRRPRPRGREGPGPDGNPTAARGYAVEGGARLPPSRAARCTPPPRGRPVRPPAPHWPLAPPHRVPAGFAGTQTEERGHQVRAAHTSSVTRTATPSAAAEPAGGAPGRSACVTPHPVSLACTRSHPVRGAGVSGVCSAFLVTNEAECFSHVYGHFNGIFLNRRLRSLALSAEQAPFEMLQESRLRGRPRPA